MAITKDVAHRVQIEENGTVLVQRILYHTDSDDGLRKAVDIHRSAFTPDTPLAVLPAGRIRQIAQVVWTPQVIAAYIAARDAAAEEARVMLGIPADTPSKKKRTRARKTS